MATTPCERWKALLYDLVMDPQKAELSRINPAERDMLRKHVEHCEACQEANDRTAFLEFDGECPGALDKLEDFLSEDGDEPDKWKVN